MKKILRVNAEEDFSGIHEDPYRDYYEDRLFTGIGYTLGYLGQIYEERSFQDGVQDGYYRRWWGQGQLLEEGFYENGYPKGVFRRWHENGQLNFFQLYEGEVDSLVLHKEWDIDGNLIKKKQRVKKEAGMIAETHAITQEWHVTGELKEEVLYEFGILCEKKIWSKTGDLEEHFQIDVSDYNFKYLQKYRRTSDFPNPFKLSK